MSPGLIERYKRERMSPKKGGTVRKCGAASAQLGMPDEGKMKGALKSNAFLPEMLKST